MRRILKGNLMPGIVVLCLLLMVACGGSSDSTTDTVQSNDTSSNSDSTGSPDSSGTEDTTSTLDFTINLDVGNSGCKLLGTWNIDIGSDLGTVTYNDNGTVDVKVGTTVDMVNNYTFDGTTLTINDSGGVVCPNDTGGTYLVLFTNNCKTVQLSVGKDDCEVRRSAFKDLLATKQ